MKNNKNQWTPTREAITTVTANMLFVASIFLLDWLVDTVDAFQDVSQSTILALNFLIVILVGFLTYSAYVDRPWWPTTKLAKKNEQARKQVHREWWKAVKITQTLLEMLESEFDRSVAAQRDKDDEKTHVLNGLARTSIKETKSAISSIQSGFPEDALRTWRTLFEIQVKSGYIKTRKPHVATRFKDWAEMSYLRLVRPEDERLKHLEGRYINRFNIRNPYGWTNNPPHNLEGMAKEIGLEYGTDKQDISSLDIYKLANSFVHVDWLSSNSALGDVDVEITDGAAEGVGEILYIIMKTMVETIEPFVPSEKQEKAIRQLNELSVEVRAAPERLRNTFIQMPLTLHEILPTGQIVFHTIKRREEWPEEAEARSMRDIQEILAKIRRDRGEEERPENGRYH